MQTASSVQRTPSKVFGRVSASSRDSGKRLAANAPEIAAVNAAQRVIKLRGARVSETLPRAWGECCRIVEWVNREGQYSCLAVPGDASEEEIRCRMRSHRNGPQYLVTDDRELPVKVVLPRA
ncbi:DUF2866 domain-containing protein [Burkholderia sp. S171]|uniref:DUF2866 domain-containing protein n=1 Tax=Burkholderia sp. S171 TaxID=1641860 RepID=UPI00131C4005|nr:DUF2866 domain-containing protein [Burkholderia sp. S171]